MPFLSTYLRPAFVHALVAMGQLASMAWAQTGMQAAEAAPQEIRQLMRQGQSAQALERVEKLVAGRPNDAGPRFLKGVILSDLGRTNEAVTTYQKLIEDFPELPEPYNNLAALYAQRQEFEKSREALDSAIRANPDYALARENLGDIYLRLAIQEYNKAIQIEKANAGAQKKLAAIRDLLAPGSSAAK